MKKFIIAFLLLISYNSFSQVGLKGFTVGGNTTEDKVTTTVGGLPGILTFDKMNSGKIWKINFSSSKSYRPDGTQFDKVSFYNDLVQLIDGIEENYTISFKNSDLVLDQIIEVRSLQFSTTKNGIEYDIATHGKRMGDKEWISFSIRSIRLNEIHRNQNPNKHDY